MSLSDIGIVRQRHRDSMKQDAAGPASKTWRSEVHRGGMMHQADLLLEKLRSPLLMSAGCCACCGSPGRPVRSRSALADLFILLRLTAWFCTQCHVNVSDNRWR